MDVGLISFGEGERVQAIIRRHFILILGPAIGFFLFFCTGGVALFLFLGFGFIQTILSPIPLFFILLSLFFLTLWTLFFSVFLHYYLDAWVVTTERIIDIEQISFFARDVSEFRLDRVQDITVVVRGLLETTLDFGDIRITTAGATTGFTIKSVPKPAELRKLISATIDSKNKKILENNNV